MNYTPDEGVEVTIKLTNEMARAVLRCEGFSNGHGVRKPLALMVAEERIVGAIADAMREVASDE